MGNRVAKVLIFGTLRRMTLTLRQAGDEEEGEGGFGDMDGEGDVSREGNADEGQEGRAEEKEGGSPEVP